jgi:hypothetical protein
VVLGSNPEVALSVHQQAIDDTEGFTLNALGADDVIVSRFPQSTFGPQPNRAEWIKGDAKQIAH